MNKVKTLQVQQADGSFSNKIPISVDATNVEMANQNSLQETIGNLNVKTGKNITQTLSELKENIANLNDTKANKSDIGSPRIASKASDMKDKTLVYVYTGSQSGYIKGNWYSWNGSSWVSGGAYNSAIVETDKTLSVSGQPADAAAVRQALDQITVDTGRLGLELEPTDNNEYKISPTYNGTPGIGIPIIDTTLNRQGLAAESKAVKNSISTAKGELQQIIDDLSTNVNKDISTLKNSTVREDRPNLQDQIDGLKDQTVSLEASGSLQNQINDLNENFTQEISDLREEVLGDETQGGSGTSLREQLTQLKKDTLGTETGDNSLKQQLDKLEKDTLGTETGDNSLKQQLDQVKEDLEDSIENAIKPNDLGLYQDNEKRIFPTFRGTASNNGLIVSPVTDATLSISNMAADAGAVGALIQDIHSDIDNITIEVDDLGLEQDKDTGIVYPTYRGERSENGIPLSGGGGGGGTDINNATLTATNISGWLSKSLPSGSDCPIQIRWSSIEDDEPTGSGSARITVNNTIRGVIQIQQGDIEINLKPYLSIGQNTVKIRISDVYDNGRTLNFNINYINFNIDSQFVFDTPFTQSFLYTFTPYGSGVKTIHFKIDGQELETMETSASGQQLNYLIPAQTHGGHSLECYFTAILDGEEITSNVLYNEFMFIEESNLNPIITSSFNETSFDQYTSIVIPYRAYDPLSESTEVSIYVNGILNSTYENIDRTQHNFIYKADKPGTTSISFEIRGQNLKVITLNIKAINIDIQAVTDDLALYLSSQGRSNNEKADIRSSWIYNDISAEFRNFNWILDGWQVDSQNIPVLRVMGDGRVYIPYNVFGSDCKSTGKTIEIEFSTSYVVDYNSPVIECLNRTTTGTTDPVGFSITSQQVTISGAQTTRETLYKDNEHIRVSIVIEKQNKNRLLYIYVNGVMSRVVQYAAGERFAQLEPTGILIGSNDCAVDIYCIRIYDNDLSRRQVLNNWIADTQDGGDFVNRYNRNNVYEDDNITVNSLPNNLPYMIIEAEKLSQYKGDKQTVSGSYVDPTDPSKSFTFTGCQNNVQGTSSQGYYRKNYDMQFKEGFELNTGHADNYGLRKNSIPFNRFVLKADVASSESANNTRLTMFYNDTCLYKIPEMEEDNRVRWGIEGVPIAVFWFNPETNVTMFLGKYNFNLPKRAPAPYGYADESSNDESWEFQWNNTANVKFQDVDFTTEKWDEENQTNKPAWYDDWQARFPSDSFRNTDQLKELVAWVNSTWINAATNDNLSSPVTYRIPSTAIFDREECEGDNSYTITEVKNAQQATIGYDVRFTKDTAACRLAKFRAQFSDYFEVRSATFYFIFTEFFLMIDSWAKNMFIGFHGSPITTPGRKMRRKAVIEPYDMDTAIGINNSGELMFDYHYETIDTVSSLISGGEGAAQGKQTPVMNAQDSVLWSNFRDTFRAEIVSMYSTLRSTTWNYNTVANMFTQHQSKWPEAIFNEDAYMKYLYPVDHAVVRNPNQADETKPDAYMTTTEYLKMLQGSKQQQRRWWLFNRFRYIDSKYNTGDAQNTRITLRIFDNDPVDGITLSSAIDMYEGVMFGAGSTPILIRTDANSPKHFIYNGTSSIQEFETHILSGDMVVDVGDLSKFSPNEIKFSNASRLRRLKVGDASRSNPNLTELDVTNSSLLEYIDCRNCTNLANPIDLSNSPRLKEAYFNGTKLKGVEFADGGLLETLYLPASITSLALLNLSKLTTVSIPSYSNITSLYLANIDVNKINPVTVLNAMPNKSYVHIEGFDLEVSSEQQIRNIYNLLERMQGQSRERVWNETSQRYSWNYNYYEHPIVSGTITLLPPSGETTSSISGSLKALINAHYPSLEIKADKTTSNVYYYNWDGSELLYTEEVIADKNNPEPNAVYSGQPARPADAHYTYTFIGWALEPNGKMNNNAKRNIQSDRNLYAAYSFVGQTYRVRFLNDNGRVLQTTNDVLYGATVPYTGSTPVSSKGSAEEFEFKGWSPSNENIQGNTDCYAQYEDIRSIVSQFLAGTLDNFDLSTADKIAPYSFYFYPKGITINQINADTISQSAFYKADGGLYIKAPNKYLTIKSNIIQSMAFYGSLPTYNDSIDTIDLINTSDKIEIKNSAFISNIYNKNSNFNRLIIRSPQMAVLSDLASNILPSPFYTIKGAIFVPNNLVQTYKNNTNWEPCYSNIFSLDQLTTIDNLNFESISDSWEQIVTNSKNGTYKTKYHIGDIKKFHIGDKEYYAKLIGIDADTIYGTSDKAPMTWLSYNIGSYQMNSTVSTTNGWRQMDLRTKLREQILPSMDNAIKNNILVIDKTYYDYDTGTTLHINDNISIPSYRELYSSNSFENSGVIYGSKFSFRQMNPEDNDYWVRTSVNTSAFETIYGYSSSSYTVTSQRPVRILFSL